ncbi:MAG: hypothetical protein HYY03_00490 [Chloroflexi bacterium]|nr:hypothetical protein [Chloroflexota bacterium]
MAHQTASGIRLKCPYCSVQMVESADMWGPVYVCHACGYATDEDALNRALSMDLGSLLGRSAGLLSGAIEREGFGPR